MRQITLFFSIGIILISCNSPRDVRVKEVTPPSHRTFPAKTEKPKEKSLDMPVIHYDLRDFPAIAKEKNIDSLIARMIRGKCVYDKAVGYAGQYTEEYANFDRLCELISEKELFDLVKHPNPIVRLYAYHGLFFSESNYKNEAREMLKKDTAKVCMFSGCDISTQKLKNVWIVKND